MAKVPIQVEYNEELRPLERLLDGVDRPGDFFAHGEVEIPLPKVEVEGVGTLSFPVPAHQVAALLGQALQAPYGRGEETVVDTTVRKVWQITPERVRISGKSWPGHFETILRRVMAGLGVDREIVSAELYKLLVYDEGGFFLAHRDTEKAPGMFGTLVLTLPCAHRGGELVIRHAGREVEVDMSGGDVSEVVFAAFYADCEHEVRPITAGHRVCLVYNLAQRQGAGSAASIHPPDCEPQTAQAAALLEKSLSNPDGPVKIAWLLEHQYSPAGLSFSGLKPVDAARVKVLSGAAERAGCTAHLAIVHIEESGSAEPSGDYPRGWDDEDESDEDEDFEVVEVCDWRHYADQWRDQQDRPMEFGEIPLGEGELLPAGALSEERPDEQRLMEATGNEGASFERSYHRAALVLWRTDRYAEVLLQAGAMAALPLLRQHLATCRGQDEASPSHREAASLARLIIDAWHRQPPHSFETQQVPPARRADMLELLIDLGDADLLLTFIRESIPREYDGSENPMLAASVAVLGPREAATAFSELIARQMRHFPGPCIDLLLAVTDGIALNKDGEWARHALRETLVAALDDVGTLPPAPWSPSRPALPGIVDAALITKLWAALVAPGSQTLRESAAGKMAARPAVFDPAGVLVPALATFAPTVGGDTAFSLLWEHCAEFLLQRSARPPEAPRDWHQEVIIPCRCEDCRQLQTFAQSPTSQAHRFRVRKERRQHLHQMIERHRLEMTHATERSGSPQTLVCTKDRRHHLSRCAQYRQDIDAMTRLIKLSASAGADPRALQAAVALQEG